MKVLALWLLLVVPPSIAYDDVYFSFPVGDGSSQTTSNTTTTFTYFGAVSSYSSFALRFFPAAGTQAYTYFYTIDGIPGGSTSYTFTMPEWLPSGDYWIAMTEGLSNNVAAYGPNFTNTRIGCLNHDICASDEYCDVENKCYECSYCEEALDAIDNVCPVKCGSVLQLPIGSTLPAGSTEVDEIGSIQNVIRPGTARYISELITSSVANVAYGNSNGTDFPNIMSIQADSKLEVLAGLLLTNDQFSAVSASIRVIQAYVIAPVDVSAVTVSYHHEGRALRLELYCGGVQCTNATLVGNFARLARFAGFDWVHFESSTIVYVSVVKNGCRTPVDLVMLIDSSGSIEDPKPAQGGTPGIFGDRVLPFVKDLAGRFEIGPLNNQSRIGVATFASSAIKRFDLGDHFTQASFDAAVDAITYTGGQTYTAAGLNLVRTQMLTTGAGMRDDSLDIPKIVVVVTDGQASPLQSPATEATIYHNLDPKVTVFAIGVGRNPDTVQLGQMATDPDDKYRFTIKSYSRIGDIVDTIAQEACEESVGIYCGDSSVISIDNGDSKFYQVLNQGNQYLTLTVTVTTGNVNVYTSTSESTPGPFSYQLKHDSGESVKTITMAVSQTDDVYVSIVGLSASGNQFSFSLGCSNTAWPTVAPTRGPTTPTPTLAPITSHPTAAPASSQPSNSPSTSQPTPQPTVVPSINPSTTGPTFGPSQSPTTSSPTPNPTIAPQSSSPSVTPTHAPRTTSPSAIPTTSPQTSSPSTQPTDTPSTSAPTPYPTMAPSTRVPTSTPSSSPSTSPPTPTPSLTPSTSSPTPLPSSSPTASTPTSTPTESPSYSNPSAAPSTLPTESAPSAAPSMIPTKAPSSRAPTPADATFSPTVRPSTSIPSTDPTFGPSASPTSFPTRVPSSSLPSAVPTKTPSINPTRFPTLEPSTSPTKHPSTGLTGVPTPAPTRRRIIICWTPDCRDITGNFSRAPTTSPVTSTPTVDGYTWPPTNAPNRNPTETPSTTSPTQPGYTYPPSTSNGLGFGSGDPLTVLESEEIGFSVIRITAFWDVDGSPAAATYSLSPLPLVSRSRRAQHDLPFVIDQITGEITLSALVDFETQPQWQMLVSASSGGITGTGALTIDIEAVPCPPGTWSLTGTYTCSDHLECAVGETEVSPPTVTSDRVCLSSSALASSEEETAGLLFLLLLLLFLVGGFIYRRKARTEEFTMKAPEDDHGLNPMFSGTEFHDVALKSDQVTDDDNNYNMAAGNKAWSTPTYSEASHNVGSIGEYLSADQEAKRQSNVYEIATQSPSEAVYEVASSNDPAVLGEKSVYDSAASSTDPVYDLGVQPTESEIDAPVYDNRPYRSDSYGRALDDVAVYDRGSGQKANVAMYDSASTSQVANEVQYENASKDGVPVYDVGTESAVSATPPVYDAASPVSDSTTLKPATYVSASPAAADNTLKPAVYDAASPVSDSTTLKPATYVSASQAAADNTLKPAVYDAASPVSDSTTLKPAVYDSASSSLAANSVQIPLVYSRADGSHQANSGAPAPTYDVGAADGAKYASAEVAGMPTYDVADDVELDCEPALISGDYIQTEAVDEDAHLDDSIESHNEFKIENGSVRLKSVQRKNPLYSDRRGGSSYGKNGPEPILEDDV